jgi:hypothetical protein
MANDSQGACAGLANYRSPMLKAGERWMKGMKRDGLLGRSVQSFDQAEWQDYGARAERLLADFKKIEPPAFATSWHRGMMKSARLKLEFAAVAPVLGFDATAQVYGLHVTRTKSILADGSKAASETCAAFAEFQHEWDGLDGQERATDA